MAKNRKRVDGCLATVPIDGAFRAQHHQLVQSLLSSGTLNRKYLDPDKDLAYICACIGEDLARYASEEQWRNALEAYYTFGLYALASVLLREWHFPGWREVKGKDQDALNRAADVFAQINTVVLQRRNKYDPARHPDPCQYFVWPEVRHRWLDAVEPLPNRTPEWCIRHCQDHCDGYRPLMEGNIDDWRGLNCPSKKVIPRHIGTYQENEKLDEELTLLDDLNGTRIPQEYLVVPWDTTPDSGTEDLAIALASPRLGEQLLGDGIITPGQVPFVNLLFGTMGGVKDYRLLSQALGISEDYARHLDKRVIGRFERSIETCLLNGFAKGDDGVRRLEFASHSTTARVALHEMLSRAWQTVSLPQPSVWEDQVWPLVTEQLKKIFDGRCEPHIPSGIPPILFAHIPHFEILWNHILEHANSQGRRFKLSVDNTILHALAELLRLMNSPSVSVMVSGSPAAETLERVLYRLKDYKVSSDGKITREPLFNVDPFPQLSRHLFLSKTPVAAPYFVPKQLLQKMRKGIFGCVDISGIKPDTPSEELNRFIQLEKPGELDVVYYERNWRSLLDLVPNMPWELEELGLLGEEREKNLKKVDKKINSKLRRAKDP